MTEPTAILEEALRHTSLNEPAKESLRQRMKAAQINAVMAGARARVEHERAIAACGSTSPLIGGSDPGECDAPRETGHGREGLTAGKARSGARARLGL